MKQNYLILLILIACNFCEAKNSKSQYGFIENRGQIIDQNNIPNKDVLYLYNGNSLNVHLKQNGFSYEIHKTENAPKTKINKHSKFELDSLDYTLYFHRIDIMFFEANKNPKIIPYEQASDYINYHTTETSEQGINNVHHYKKVLYQNIYNNIDVEFILNDSKQNGDFKYNFIVRPGGNINDIQLKFDGATSTSLTVNGHIIIETTYGNIDESIPYSYQLNNDKEEQKINVLFDIQDSVYNIFNLKTGAYDNTKTLVIDPTPWSTYFGGSGYESGYSITTDTSGNIFTTGATNSSSNIATSGAYQSTYGGSPWDAFIVKFNSSGTRLWATYYGGSNSDQAFSITSDNVGNILITGQTQSSSGIATSGSFKTTLSGATIDVFIAKFNASGNLLWGSYFGGTGNDYGTGITIDVGGSILVTGYTESTSGIATSGAYKTTRTAFPNVFILKLSSSGTTRYWGTYYGGTSEDYASGITTDGAGNIFINGYTGSSTGIATTGAYHTTRSTIYNDFIAKFNAGGTTLLWGTYYGGGSNPDYSGIVADANGNVYVTGVAYDTSGIATTGAYQTTRIGPSDAYIAKFSSTGSILWGTYYGGNGNDVGCGIALDTTGKIYITGSTESTSGIATTGAYQTVFGGGSTTSTPTDAFMVKFNSTGVRLWGTYLGGSNNDEGYGIAIDANGNTFITGRTASTSAIAITGAYQVAHGGGLWDAFISAFTSNGSLPVKLITFNAKLQDKNTVLCNWSTASEVNNDRFEVERSMDNTQWKLVGKVKGNGTTNSISNYQLLDAFTLPNTIGVLYYRIKQVDLDGAFTYSEIKVVNLNSAKTDVEIYPNPSSNKLLIQSNQIQEISIIDILGNAISINFQTINNNETQIDVSAFNSGIYFLKITTQQNTIIKKIIIE